MNVSLNDFRKKELTETVKNLQSHSNVPRTTMVPACAVDKIYDALLEALKCCRIDDSTRDYIKTMVRNHDMTERSIEDYVDRLKVRINQSADGRYPADFALRCLLAVLRDGQMNYPDDNRPIFAKVFGIGKMSDGERIDWEEDRLQPIARNLVEIVNYYYQSRN